MIYTSSPQRPAKAVHIDDKMDRGLRRIEQALKWAMVVVGITAAFFFLHVYF